MYENLMLSLRLRARSVRGALYKLSDQLYLSANKNSHEDERLPDFLIIGAMKAGTTALHHSLAQHPEVFMTYVKEPSLFLDKSPWLQQNPYVKSAERMHRLMFRGYQGQKLVGESSTTYTEFPSLGAEAPENIARDAPDMKLIYIMRNPFARIVSHYLHCVQMGIYSEPLTEVLKRDTTFLERSLYYSQIERYLKHFDREQLQLLFFEDFTKDPARTLREVCTFLGISENPVEHFNTKPRNETLVQKAVRTSNSRFEKPTYDALIGPIQEDCQKLEALVGRSLEDWDLTEARWCADST